MTGLPQSTKQWSGKGRIIPVSVERYATPSQKREQLFLATPRDGVILALVNTRLDQAVALADMHNLLDLVGAIVAEAEPLELALPVRVVHGAARDLKRRVAVGGMQVQHMDLGHAQRRERPLHAGFDPRLAVRPGRPGCHFGVDRGPRADVESAQERLRGPARAHGVGARGVDPGVVARAEEVEDRVGGLGGVVFGLRVGRGAEGSGSEDDFGMGGGLNHFFLVARAKERVSVWTF